MTFNRFVLLTLACAAFFVPEVQAKPSQTIQHEFRGDRYTSVAQSAYDVVRAMRCSPMNGCQRGVTKEKNKRHPFPRPRLRSVSPLTMAGGFSREVQTAATTILGGRPAGCPRRFCGCGASLHLFGRIVPQLNLAANWLRFPRTAPAANMVAARRGHVFVLKSHVAGSLWIVHDSNSGRGRTRVHPRSIAGYAIVNPHGRV